MEKRIKIITNGIERVNELKDIKEIHKLLRTKYIKSAIENSDIMINPEWNTFSCQECVKEYPILKKYPRRITEFIIEQICKHKKVNSK